MFIVAVHSCGSRNREGGARGGGGAAVLVREYSG